LGGWWGPLDYRLLVGGGSKSATGGMRLFGLEMFFREMGPRPILLQALVHAPKVVRTGPDPRRH
jgi:hypothetical protein